jgi:hypothetical protein
MYWIDPDGTIDLSKIGDNIDNLPDGETYARVRTMHLDAETGLTMWEGMKYFIRFSPDTDEKSICRGDSRPSDPEAGEYWIDTSGAGSVIKRWTGAEWFTIDQDEIDALNKGILTTHAKQSSLTADGLVLLDELYVDSEAGDYGLVNRTCIQAGKILIDSLETLDQEHGLVRAAEISDGHIKLTSAVVIDGQWYNETGVIIDANSGITFKGLGAIFADDNVVIRGYVYGSTGGNLIISSSEDINLIPIGGDVYVTGNLHATKLYATSEMYIPAEA